MNIAEQLRPIFEPKSIAVIGASIDASKFGGRAIFNPLNTGYKGEIYAINPNRQEVFGVKAYPTILDVPADVDLAIIAIVAPLVPKALEECVAKGVRGAVILSAGFAEAGENGRALEEEICQIARKGGIRFVGPNSNGIWSSSVRLNLTFQTAPQTGSISFISQSGTLGMYLFQVAASKGYGFSKFVSSGNQASLDVSDYLEYLAQDEDTKAIVLYIEGITQGRRFFEIAKETVKRKPIVVFKGGCTNVGARATLSHTASMSGSDEVFDALCRQAGIIRCQETIHPFDVAEALTCQPLPRGKRVTIIGSGGQCVATSDACVALGLELPEFDEATKRRLMEVLPPHAPVPTNPVDTAAGREPRTLTRLLEILASLDYIDGIITQGPWTGFSPTPELVKNMLAELEGLTEINQKYRKPIVVTAMAWSSTDLTLSLLRKAGIPYYTTPEESARAMAGLVKYAQIRRTLVGE